MEKADIVISSNAVFTGETNKPEPAAIAISENKIIAIGSEDEIHSLIHDHTKIYRYDNQLIMPGFHDNHAHIMMGSVALESVDLFDARSEKEAAKMVRDFAATRPDEEWILGYTWDSGYWEDQRLPHRSSLDEVISDRPVILFHAEGHYAWVNTKALEKMNITNETPDPPYGVIERDKGGELTGILYEKAMELITKEAYDIPKLKMKEMLYHFLQHAAALGITSINDMYGSEFMEKLDNYPLLKELEDEGELTLRIHLWTALNNTIKESKELRNTYCSNKLAVKGLKQFIDGVITSKTAFMLEPYAVGETTKGESTFPPDSLKEWVTQADKDDFDVRFHAIGDGAIRLALDAFEEAQTKNGPRNSRHSVEHIEVIHPDDIKRFAQLGVVASMQPHHFAMSERSVYTKLIGEKRDENVFAINSLKEAGAHMSFGTDFPIDGLNPFSQIYIAVTRIDNTGEDTWNPGEKISLAEALMAYTIGPAYSASREHELGTLEKGKLADIVVLDRNLFDLPEEEIPETNVSLTISDGEVVYSSS